MQATEKDDTIRREQQLVQAKDREISQLRQQVANLHHLVYYETTADCEHWTTDCFSVYRNSPAGGGLVILRGSCDPVRL